jgi:hypothetical protein
MEKRFSTSPKVTAWVLRERRRKRQAANNQETTGPTYRQPGGVFTYRQPDGTSLYLQPS